MSVSLLAGWLPWTLRILALALLVAAVGRRDRRWYLTRLPILLGASLACALAAVLVVRTLMGISDPLPLDLWFWLGCAAFRFCPFGAE